jgi:hypothetical protein
LARCTAIESSPQLCLSTERITAYPHDASFPRLARHPPQSTLLPSTEQDPGRSGRHGRCRSQSGLGSQGETMIDFRTDAQQCDRSALHIIHMLQIWHRVHNLRYTPPTALQVCFVAGTTHLLSLASSRANSKKHLEAAAHLVECVRLLRFMAVSWPAAEQARLLLDGLRADYGLAGPISVPPSPRSAPRYDPIGTTNNGTSSSE